LLAKKNQIGSSEKQRHNNSHHQSIGAFPMTPSAIVTLTLLAADPLLMRAPGGAIPATGGALGAADVNGDGCADLLSCGDTTLDIFFGSRERNWPQQAVHACIRREQ
jgi:hypothetical protein